MKKFILSLGLIAMAFSLTNCVQNEEVNPSVEVKGDFALYASVSRTANDGVNTVWAAGDDLNVFHAVTDGTNYVQDGQFKLEDAATGYFLGTLAGELDSQEEYDWYAMYPYDSHVQTPAATTSGYMTIGCAASAYQTQTGNNSMAHIGGKYYPIVGKAYAVPAGSSPALAMTHVASLVEFEVTNSLEEAITVSSIQFTAPEAIVGTFYIDFSDIANIKAASSGDKYTSKSATLAVTGGVAIEKDASAKFYLPVAPFTAKSGAELTVVVNATSKIGSGVHEKSISLSKDVEFKSGKVKSVKVNYTTVIEAPAGDDDLVGWNLVTDVTTLAEGDQIIIAAKDENYALSTNQKSANRGATAITKNGNTIATPSSDVQIITLKAGSTAGTWAFYVGDGYLYAASSSANQLKTKSTLDASGSWNISMLNGAASIVASDTSNRNVMQYNPNNGSPLFACYESASQQALAIYKNYGGSTPEPATPVLSIDPTALSFDAAAGSKTVTCTIENEVSGVNVTATESVDWLTTSVSGKTVTITATANTATTTRTATVTIAYTGAESKTVTVNQAAAENTGGNEGGEKWQLITNTADLTDGEYIIVGKSQDGNVVYLPSTTTSSAPSQKVISVPGLDLTSTASFTTTLIPEDARFTFSGGASAMTIKNAAGSYLYTTSSNSGLRIGSTSGTWEIASNPNNNKALTLMFSSTSRYVSVYQSQDWRSYNSVKPDQHDSNGASGSTFIYKLVGGNGGATPEEPETPATPVLSINPTTLSFDAAAGSKTVTCTIENEVSGVDVTATENVDWLTTSVNGKTVTITATANTATTTRTATVTIAYTGAESKNVTVNQAAAENTGGGAGSTKTAKVTFSSLYSADTDVNGKVIAIDGNVNVQFNKASGSTNPKYYKNGTSVRFYAKGNFIVSSTKTITKITITYGSSDGSNAITASPGTFTSPNWTGSANSVTFTQGGSSGNRRIAAIEVTYLD